MQHSDPSVNPEWHEKRRRGIFATDVGPILRMSRFAKGPLDIAVEKIIGTSTTKAHQRLSMGKLLEPIIGKLWEEETGEGLIRPETGYHPRHSWMGANADFVCPKAKMLSGAPMIVEAKASSDRYGWGEPFSDRVPPDILLQVQWQLACYRMDVAEVAALFTLSEFVRYHIERNDKLIDLCIEICGEFWENCQRGKFPEYSWSDPRTRALMPLIYRPDGRTVVQLDEECQKLADEMEELSKAENELRALKDDRRARLHERMGSASFGLLPDGVREIRRSVVTTKAHTVAGSVQNRLTVAKRPKNREATP